MLATGRFAEFVHEFVRLENEKEEEKTIWEFYLHRVYDKSFVEFKQSLHPNAKPTKKDLETTVNESKSILAGFAPNRTGV